MTDPIGLPPAVVRDDTRSILSYIQNARIVSAARETALARLQAWLIRRFWSGIVTFAIGIAVAFVLSRFAPFRPYFALIATLLVIVLASRMGALVSIGRRMRTETIGTSVNSDSIYTLAALGSGKSGLGFALLSANVFGLVLYALFASGLPATIGLTGGIVPRFVAVEAEGLLDRVRADDQRASELEAAAAKCAGSQVTPPAAVTSARTARTAPAAERAPDTPSDAANAVETNTGAGVDDGTGGGTDTDTDTGTAPSCDELFRYARLAREQATVSRTLFEQYRQVPDTGTPRQPVDAARRALGLWSSTDLFKMLLWAFIAGFFEQLVPDMLDSLKTLAQERKKRVP